jgi:hypothetical protein
MYDIIYSGRFLINVIRKMFFLYRFLHPKSLLLTLTHINQYKEYCSTHIYCMKELPINLCFINYGSECGNNLPFIINQHIFKSPLT